MIDPKKQSSVLLLTLTMTIFSCALQLVGALFLYLIVADFLIEGVDRDLRHEYQELVEICRAEGIDNAYRQIEREVEEHGADRVLFRVYSNDGQLLFSKPERAWREVKSSPKGLASFDKDLAYETVAVRNDGTRGRFVVGALNNARVVQVGVSLDHYDNFLGELRLILLCVTISIAFFLSAGSWHLASWAFRGVEKVALAAEAFSAGELDCRVNLASGGRDVIRLAENFNAMAGRLQELIREMREVNDDIAHDLRSPLTRMRGAAEIAITHDEFKSLAIFVVEECDKMLATVNTMLEITELEAGVSPLHLQAVDLTELAKIACDLYRSLSEERGVELKLDAEPGVGIRGDLNKIQRLLANLLDNAFNHTDPGDRITVIIERSETLVRMLVRDSGRGIPDENIEKIFQRFYRGDNSRGSRGNGLGLNLARGIAQAHGARILVRSSLGAGSEFSVEFPRPASP